MMRAMLLVVFCVVATNAFRFTPRPIMRRTIINRLSMASEGESDKKDLSLVPVDRENVQSAAAVTGGILGLVLGGPILAAVLAAVSNYAAKQDNEAGEALRGFGTAAVESYNYLTKLNSKFNLTNKLTATIDSAVNSVSTSDNETLGKVKETLSTTVSKLDELNKEYDLLAKGKEVIVAAATLSDAAIEKAIELNQKYDVVSTVTSKAADVTNKAIDKARESLNKAN